MVQRIKINLEAIEAMLYYWHALKDKEKVAEKFIYDITEMPGLSDAYDSEFDAESVRRALSAIKNRETFAGRSKKESRFWNNNLWMLEDLGVTDAMVQPIKQLNLDDLPGKLEGLSGACNYEEAEVIFAPLHIDEYIIEGNKLVINFFKVQPVESGAQIQGQDLKEFILDKLKELLRK